MAKFPSLSAPPRTFLAFPTFRSFNSRLTFGLPCVAEPTDFFLVPLRLLGISYPPFPFERLRNLRMSNSDRPAVHVVPLAPVTQAGTRCCTGNLPAVGELCTALPRLLPIGHSSPSVGGIKELTSRSAF